MIFISGLVLHIARPFLLSYQRTGCAKMDAFSNIFSTDKPIMLTIQQLYHQVTANIPDFKPRDSQVEMVDVIDECFSNVTEDNKDGHNICLIEAPTGTGKSFAYILAGINNAQKLGKKFLICTATKTLQSQLYNKDMPNYIRASKNSVSYGLAKGRSNYLCPYQLEANLMNAGADMVSQSDGTSEKLHKISQAFEKQDWDGDLDNAPLFIESRVKPLITADKHQCLGYQCPFNQKDDCNCPFYKNREYLRSCDVIITNHSLLLADLDGGGGMVLPWRPDDYLLCVDEAHNFTDYAINGFMGQFDLKQSIGLVENAAKLIANAATNSYIIDNIQLCDQTVTSLNELSVALDRFYHLIRLNQSLFDNGTLILNDYLNSAITQEVKDLFIEVAFSAGESVAGIEAIQEKLKEKIKNASDYTSEANLIKLGFYFSSVEGIANTANYLVNEDKSRFNANARWVEHKLINNNDEYVVIAGVTHVGNVLKNKLWDRVYGACLTSATLAIGERFEYSKFQLGLNLLPEVKATKLDTNFNYPLHSQLVIPQFRYAPEFNSREMFQKELTMYLGQILNYSQAYGTLVLFFNRQQLIDTFKQLPLKLQNRILLQTEFSSNQKLITEHKEIVDEGSPSIIFGLNSFAEGVDLPTRYCMHVVVTKLPFETHKDPQNMVREYWVKAENGNFFMDVSLPETCIRLIQAVGRLIRSEEDYGQVTICDNRIVLKQYGSILLNALPKFNCSYNPEFINTAYKKIKH